MSGCIPLNLISTKHNHDIVYYTDTLKTTGKKYNLTVISFILEKF